METKFFEIRANGTCIPIMATKLKPKTDQERWLLAHLGYGLTAEMQAQYIMVVRLEGNSIATTQAYAHTSWEVQIAHKFLDKHFDEIPSGAVLDVDFIEGRTTKPRESDRFYYKHQLETT